MFDILERHAFVTGGASGIGLAIVRRFLDAGARVSVADLQTSDELAGLAAHYASADVSDAARLAAALDAAVAANGPIDILINNAGIGGELRELEASDEHDLEAVLAVNYRGVVNGLGLAPTRMRDGGSIVNTASLAAFMGVRGYGHYAASKAAVVSLTRTAATELAARRIRCNAVCPGPVRTSMAPEGGMEDRLSAMTTLLGRSATVEELAGVYHFLASDDARYINGQALIVDGGWLGFVPDALIEAAGGADALS